MKTPLKIVLAANLLVLAVLAFVYPHLMVGPGKLIPGHAGLETDCFACHAPFTGATTARCTSCHVPKDIGRLTTRGQPIVKPLTSVPFHQQLTKQECLACHSDHAGVKRFRAGARFDHGLLQAEAGKACESCHEKPTDTLHRQLSGECGRCHTQQRWRPATFDHDRYFVLDRDHDAPCDTCHARGDFGRYTCYGCHEHTPDNIRREHIGEGIRDFKNCVECHRSANEHDIRMPGRENSRENTSDGTRDDD